MSETFSQTRLIHSCIDRLQRGEEEARGELLNLACERLMRLTRTMKQDFPAVIRWEQTDDVFQNASLRLYQSLADVTVNDTRHFFNLAALQIRRELIDLARHYQGPLGMGRHHYTQGVADFDASQPGAPAWEQAEVTQDPQRLSDWAEMHEVIGALPDEEREVFDLLWYNDVPQEEAAEMLKISVRQLKRRWRSAKLSLHDRLDGQCPSL